jgi:hypothetical protein
MEMEYIVVQTSKQIHEDEPSSAIFFIPGSFFTP